MFVHKEKDMVCSVHGDDFTFCGLHEDLMWVKGWMKDWFDIKDRGTLGFGKDELKEITVFGNSEVALHRARGPY